MVTLRKRKAAGDGDETKAPATIKPARARTETKSKSRHVIKPTPSLLPPTASENAHSSEPKSSSKNEPLFAPSTNLSTQPHSSSTSKQYWLMKAEPESRIEDGVDVKFSIDDLAERTVPEPWDGVRNPVARNNLKAMRKGDLAFFYHSNCKVPGVVGIMEIVQEATPDPSAEAEAKAKGKTGENKWVLVHVKFREKFDKMVSLKQLQQHKGPGQELENMQNLRLARLSVAKVSPDEWAFVRKLARGD